jgi:hypothetical protein
MGMFFWCRRRKIIIKIKLSNGYHYDFLKKKNQVKKTLLGCISLDMIFDFEVNVVAIGKGAKHKHST